MNNGLKRILFNLNYSLIEVNVKVYATVGIVAETLFYLFTRFYLNISDLALLRVLAIILFAVMYFFPTNSWKLFHKIYYEIVLALTIPCMFIFMVIYTQNSLIWVAALIFGAVVYGSLSKTIIAIPVYIVAYPLMRSISSWMNIFDKTLARDLITIQMVALLTFLIVCIIKLQLEHVYYEHEKTIKNAKQINDTFSSLIYISSELSMYDDLETIYHMLIQRLNSLFPNSSLALLITTDTCKILNQVYHDVTSKEQQFITRRFNHLIDPYTLTVKSECKDIESEVMNFFESWLVFNKDYSVRTAGELHTYNITLFIKNKLITDNEMHSFHYLLLVCS